MGKGLDCQYSLLQLRLTIAYNSTLQQAGGGMETLSPKPGTPWYMPLEVLQEI